MIRASANPLGEGCTAYSSRIPQHRPSPSNALKSGKSLGVQIIKMSHMPVCISVTNG